MIVTAPAEIASGIPVSFFHSHRCSASDFRRIFVIGGCEYAYCRLVGKRVCRRARFIKYTTVRDEDLSEDTFPLQPAHKAIE